MEEEHREDDFEIQNLMEWVSGLDLEYCNQILWEVDATIVKTENIAIQFGTTSTQCVMESVNYNILAKHANGVSWRELAFVGHPGFDNMKDASKHILPLFVHVDSSCDGLTHSAATQLVVFIKSGN